MLKLVGVATIAALLYVCMHSLCYMNVKNNDCQRSKFMYNSQSLFICIDEENCQYL